MGRLLSNTLGVVVLFCLPVLANAQVDKIKKGMTIGEVMKVFPGLEQDFYTLNSTIYDTSKVDDIKGLISFTFNRDTLSRYEFLSKSFDGPCEEFPNADSTEYLQLMSAIGKLYNKYLLIYGKPTNYFSQSPLANHDKEFPLEVFYAKWKEGNNELVMGVGYPGKNKLSEITKPSPAIQEQKQGCRYTFHIISIGKGKKFEQSCQNGITGEDFKKLFPDLASKVATSSDDRWKAHDTLTFNTAQWKFGFKSGRLDSYHLDIYNAPGYPKGIDSAYSKLRKRTMALTAEAERLYGRYDTSSEMPPLAYPRKEANHNPNAIYFKAEWTIPESRKLRVLFYEHTIDKQYEPQFLLSVSFEGSIENEK